MRSKLIIAIILTLAIIHFPTTSVADYSNSDRACGSRCVAFVLEKFERAPPNLIDIIREVQDGDPDKAASFEDLSLYLTRRGFANYTLSNVSLGKIAELNVAAIFHVDAMGGGHFFAVGGWDAQSDLAQVYLYEGEQELIQLPISDLEEIQYNAVMIISPDKEILASVLAMRNSRRDAISLGIAMALLCIGIILLVIDRAGGREGSRGKRVADA